MFRRRSMIPTAGRKRGSVWKYRAGHQASGYRLRGRTPSEIFYLGSHQFILTCDSERAVFGTFAHCTASSVLLWTRGLFYFLSKIRLNAIQCHTNL